jgi:hypothetical protein
MYFLFDPKIGKQNLNVVVCVGVVGSILIFLFCFFIRLLIYQQTDQNTREIMDYFFGTNQPQIKKPHSLCAVEIITH